jgi:hypothetical protein
VDISIRAVQARRHFEETHRAGGFKITGLAGLDAGIARLAKDNRHPADFEFGARADDQISHARAGDQAWARLDLVRVLQPVGCGIDRDLVAAQLLRQRGPFGLAGKDVEGGVGWAGRREDEGGECREAKAVHRAFLQ